MLLSQHSFAVAEPMSCEHQKDSSTTHIMKSATDIHYDSISDNNLHHVENSHDATHNHVDEECEKCNPNDCFCCEGGFCASFYFNAYFEQEEEVANSNINKELIIQRIPSPDSGIHLLPYRPPIIV
ncbi:hypothetical protein L1D51_06655 [Pseudoalteromonas shioyasakiensis]|uniref:hypothetical protein n=1 Tax=Pseudoalteromonas shioyasakiensis TaxID=1190813 RepID=UPI001EFEDC9D|nr:hypothetical protein [Pseudoalteromonas shioyasakiensis]MCG9733674.1 hypothetical protein [Pseudoalteromonas shioyasakiensis]